MTTMLRTSLSMLLAAAVQADGNLRIQGADATIQLGDAVLRTSCPSSLQVQTKRIMPLRMPPGYQAVNVTAYLANVKASCGGELSTTPCAVGDANTDSHEPGFSCIYTDPETPASVANITIGPFHAARRADSEGGVVLGIDTFVVCPVPSFDQFVQVTGYNFSPEDVRLRLTLAHGVAGPVQIIPFHGPPSADVLIFHDIPRPPSSPMPPAVPAPLLPPAPPAPPPAGPVIGPKAGPYTWGSLGSVNAWLQVNVDPQVPSESIYRAFCIARGTSIPSGNHPGTAVSYTSGSQSRSENQAARSFYESYIQTSPHVSDLSTFYDNVIILQGDSDEDCFAFNYEPGSLWAFGDPSSGSGASFCRYLTSRFSDGTLKPFKYWVVLCRS